MKSFITFIIALSICPASFGQFPEHLIIRNSSTVSQNFFKGNWKLKEIKDTLGRHVDIATPDEYKGDPCEESQYFPNMNLKGKKAHLINNHVDAKVSFRYVEDGYLEFTNQSCKHPLRYGVNLIDEKNLIVIVALRAHGNKIFYAVMYYEKTE